MKNLIIVALFGLATCGDPDASVPAAEAGLETASQSAARSPLPGDVEFSVIEESTLPGVKRSLDVRITHRVSELELRAIAEDLKNRDPDHYDRTFIVYYLPGMEPGAGGWATSHFDPELDIRILGTTVEQEERLASPSETESAQDVIGVWASDQPYMPARTTLYREGGKTFILQRYSDGSGSPAEVVESETRSGRRYQKPGSGDYFLLTSSGELEIRDAEGLIATLRPVR